MSDNGQKTFAIADLHGRRDLLEMALAEIEVMAPGGTVVFTGDYVDRGPESAQIIRRLMDGPPANWRWICLKGNHEDMMVDHCRTGLNIDLWLQNGGGATLLSYGHPRSGAIDLSVVPEDHLRWIDQLPTYWEDERRVFVHAGVHRTRPLEEQSEHQLLWTLYGSRDPGGWRDKLVVHGHEQFEDGPKLHLGRIDLDTFAWATGRLVVGVFDDTQGAPIDLIEVKGSADRRFAA